MKLAAMIDTRMHDAEEVRILQNLSMLKNASGALL